MAKGNGRMGISLCQQFLSLWLIVLMSMGGRCNSCNVDSLRDEIFSFFITRVSADHVLFPHTVVQAPAEESWRRRAGSPQIQSSSKSWSLRLSSTCLMRTWSMMPSCLNTSGAINSGLSASSCSPRLKR